MNYYRFNGEEILQKEKEKSWWVLCTKQRSYKRKVKRVIKTQEEKEEKDKIKEYERKKYQELVQYKNEALKIKCFFVFSLI